MSERTILFLAEPQSVSGIFPALRDAGVQAGVADGHHFQNRGTADVVMLEVGARDPACAAHYPDIDLVAPAHARPAIYTHTDGTPYTDIKRRGPG